MCRKCQKLKSEMVVFSSRWVDGYCIDYGKWKDWKAQKAKHHIK